MAGSVDMAVSRSGFPGGGRARRELARKDHLEGSGCLHVYTFGRL